MDEMIRFADQEMSVEEAGGKAASLRKMLEFQVPEWFVITPAAFVASGCLEYESSQWELDETISEKLQRALDCLAEEEGCFAVRSSAVDEDSQGFSFAGQFESYLGVPRDEVAGKVVDVWRSAFSENIRAYRAEHNLGECLPPAVIVQRMINAESAGVCFAVDPISGNWGHALVSSVWGLGNALVDGELDGDTYRIDRRNQVLEKQAGVKNFGYYLEEGMARKQFHDQQKAEAFSIEDRQVVEVAQLARLCSKKHGIPQDIEWAFENGKLYLLQSRPITSLGQTPDPEGKLNIWDNSNIAESYGGVTTPLTYSFARSIYEEVYRQFCKIMGVPRQVIESNSATYRGLLGLMNGRMYYNLINWYRLLACFPGFSINRGFMEQMMGVKKELGEELFDIIPRHKTNKIHSALHLLKALAGMGMSHILISRKIKRFYQRLDRALASPEVPFSDQRGDELVVSYRDLEDQLLLRWDAPLINDFFAMIYFGMLSKLCKAWCSDEHGTLQNDLVGGSGKVVSAEPARRVSEMAAFLAEDSTAVTLFQQGSLVEISKFLRQHGEMGRCYEEYLEKFGDRCVDELKLESTTLRENPLPLLRAIGHFAAREKKIDGSVAQNARKKAEQHALQKVSGRLRRRVFRFILKIARARVEDRENLRFERTRLFGRVREIMMELGKRFTALGILEEQKDIFYLEKDEILSFVEGFSSCPDLNGIAAVRKHHFEQYANMPPSADRFLTRGMVFVGNDFSMSDDEHDSGAGEHEGVRNGIGCCPGVVRGSVVVVRDPEGVELPPGSILVAERTDPGWIMLFPAASGLLVEKGSLLSHSAIVARELGLPAVVSVPGVTSWLKDGDEIEFDGSTGRVERLGGNDGD